MGGVTFEKGGRGDETETRGRENGVEGRETKAKRGKILNPFYPLAFRIRRINRVNKSKQNRGR